MSQVTAKLNDKSITPQDYKEEYKNKLVCANCSQKVFYVKQGKYFRHAPGKAEGCTVVKKDDKKEDKPTTAGETKKEEPKKEDKPKEKVPPELPMPLYFYSNPVTFLKMELKHNKMYGQAYYKISKVFPDAIHLREALEGMGFEPSEHDAYTMIHRDVTDTRLYTLKLLTVYGLKVLYERRV